MEEQANRNTTPIIAGIFALIAIALVIIGALVVVDHINLAGTNQAASVQEQQKAAAPAAAEKNAAPPPTQTPPTKTN